MDRRILVPVLLALLSGCTSVPEHPVPAKGPVAPPPATPAPAPAVPAPLTVEQVSAPPPLKCDPKADARKEVRVRHLHIEAFQEGYRMAGPAASPGELVAAYNKLQLAREDLTRGESFADAWKKYSDPRKAGANPDGDLGFVKRGILPAEFNREAFCLAVGQISPVFRTQYGFHVLQVVEVRY